MSTQAPFPVNPQLTAIAIAYRNAALIADLVLPRIAAHDQFRYTKFNREESFTVPDTKIGRKSEANVVEFSGTEVIDETLDYGLKDVVPLSDLRKAEGTKMDPMGNATSGITRLIQLDREVRVAGMVFNANSYAAADKVVLAGNTQWSDYVNSNPISAILTAMDAMIMRPNKMVMGQAVWTVFRQHPKVVEAVKATGAGGVNASGVVMREAVADLLELQEIIVGQGFINNGKKGAAANYSRCWGKSASLMYTEPVSDTQAATTFGFTAESGGGLRVRDWFDEKVGTDGGQWVQVADTVKEVLPANDLGYLFSAAVA